MQIAQRKCNNFPAREPIVRRITIAPRISAALCAGAGKWKAIGVMTLPVSRPLCIARAVFSCEKLKQMSNYSQRMIGVEKLR